MSEYRIKQDINLFEIVDKYTKRISRVIDEQTLANVESQLAEYGYVKVVRCRDCVQADWFGAIGCGEFRCRVHGWTSESNDGFCAWGERRNNA